MPTDILQLCPRPHWKVPPQLLLREGLTDIPIITAVASEDLRRRSDNAADEPIQDSLNSGVWVCTGHGMYGISLGMGSGKLLSEMILGEKLGVDISMLGFRRVVGSIPALSES